MNQKQKINLYEKVRLDVLRMSFLVACIAALFALDMETLHIVLYVFGFLLSIALITHVTRRVLFPYIHLKEYTSKALEHPIGAAIIFLGVSMIISVTITAASGFFK